MQPVDLHIHSSFSDGKYNPVEIIEFAKKTGMKTISITDHDSISGIEIAINAGSKAGIEVIPGIEFSTDLDGNEVHILGYFIDYKNEKLLEFINKMKIYRLDRIKQMIEKLNELRLKIDFGMFLIYSTAIFLSEGRTLPLLW